MTTTDPALPTSEDGGVLTEEARAAFREAYATFKRGYDWHDEEAVQAGFDAMQPVVAALLSQARADGERAERLRCGDLLSRQTDEAIGEYLRGENPEVLFRALAADWSSA